MGLESDRDTIVMRAVQTALRHSVVPEELSVTRSADRRPRIALGGRSLERARQLSIRKWHVSLSHEAGMLVVLAVGCLDCSLICGVGVDLVYFNRWREIKRREPAIYRGIVRRMRGGSLAPSQLAQYWAQREAVYKALPVGKPHFAGYLAARQEMEAGYRIASTFQRGRLFGIATSFLFQKELSHGR